MLDSEAFTEVAGTILAQTRPEPRVVEIMEIDLSDLEELSAGDTMADAAAETLVDGPKVIVPPPPPFGGWLRSRWARLVPLLRVGR